MSLPYSVQVEDRLYHVIDDRISTYSVLIYGRVRDEATGTVYDATQRRAPQTPFTVQVAGTGLLVKSFADGFFCLAGYADRVFPDHAITSYPLTITITAAGYQPITQVITLPSAVPFPFIVPPIDLQRTPVQIRGRVTSTLEVNGQHPPIAQAKLIVLDIPPVTPPPPPVPHVLALRTPLHFAHASSGVVTAQAHTLTPVALAPARQLTQAARGGALKIVVNNRLGMSAGQIVQLGDDVLGEYVVIDTVTANPTPGEVTLQYPLTHSFAPNAPLRAFTDGGAIGGAAHFNRAAGAGEGLFVLDADLTADPIAVVDPSHPTEYHAVGALTDADGFYELTGISHIEMIRLQVSAVAFTTKTLPDERIDYAQAVNRVDVQLTP